MGLAAGKGLEIYNHAEQFILNYLGFETMDARRHAILEAHIKTFSWLFDGIDPAGGYTPSMEFVNWLSYNDPIF